MVSVSAYSKTGGDFRPRGFFLATAVSFGMGLVIFSTVRRWLDHVSE